jgi:hypothetical protein
VRDEGTDRDPRDGEVRGREEEAVGVPTGDVGDAGEEHEDRSADERDERDPFDGVSDVAHGRPREQPRRDDPQLGEQQGDRDESGDHVGALRDAVETRRS